MSKYRISMDIGGTFTDLVFQDGEAGHAFTNKVLSTPANQAAGVLEGLSRHVEDFDDVRFLVHGNTVGLNAFLERRGDRTLLVTTAGFRDVLHVARGHRPGLYDLHYRKPAPLVPLRDIHVVRERLNADGSVREPLIEEDVAPIIERIEREGIPSVAVCLLHAYRNPVHELRIRELIRERLPEVSISLSHEVAAEFREYERASTTTLNAYIAPKVERYLRSLQASLADRGYGGTLHVMQSNGGITTAAAAEQRPVQALLSGPVGGTIGGCTLSEHLGRPNLLCVDMGGTSFDASLVVDGKPSVSTETELEGLPILTPLVDIHTVGAGGGSIAWIEAGALRVGPHSAGADPGPACYGRGGTQPTVTDANALLGRLNPDYFLNGDMGLDLDAAARAVDSVAEPLGLGRIEAAEGILAIVNAKMALAMRTMTVAQGVDPREFALVAFGGAGPMHAAALAEELEIGEVIIPWAPGTFSAWGMLHTDIRRDVVRNHLVALTDCDVDALRREYEAMEAVGREMLDDDGVEEERRELVRLADVRYIGQEYFLTVEMPGGDQPDLMALAERFHDAYKVRYGHATPAAPIEIVNLRLVAIGHVEAEVAQPSAAAAADLPESTRTVIFEGVEHAARVVRREAIVEGVVVRGPAIVEEPTTTTTVPPGWSVRLDGLSALTMTRE